MPLVDERIVRMEFDNAAFEKGVSQTMSSLDAFKKSLNFEDSAKGFEEITKASSKVSFDGITSGLETVKEGFSSLEAFTFGIFERLGQKVTDFGTNLVKSLTIDQVNNGFNEYELKVGAVQNILAATEAQGETIETVSKYLEELNEYSDRTIYSFSDMTSNIGKFTNAGVKLEDAVLAIKGISNEAAISGANSTEAARAMYNLSQAMSLGYMQRMDWKSIENANMATMEFKTNLVKAAIEMKKLDASALDNVSVQFTDNLKKKWLTNEVMLKVLKEYADETTDLGARAYRSAQEVKTISMLFDTMKEAVQSGWAQTFELIVGNKDEAVKTLTKINDVVDAFISKSVDARNAVVKAFMEVSAPGRNLRQELGDFVKNVIKLITRVIEITRKSLKSIFSFINIEKIGQSIFKITVAFNKFVNSFEEGNSKAEKLEKTLTTLMLFIKAQINIIAQFINFVKKNINKINIDLSGLVKWAKTFFGLFDITRLEGVLSALANFRFFESDEANFSLLNVKESFKRLGESLKKDIDTLIDPIKKYFSEKFKETGEFSLKGFVKGFSDSIANISKSVVGFFKEIVSNIKDYLGIHSPSTLFKQIAQWCVEGFSIAFRAIVDTTKKVIDDLKNFLIKTGAAIKSFSSKIKNKISEIWTTFKKTDAYTTVQKIYKELGGIVGIIDLIFKGKLISSLKNLSKGFADLGEGFKNIGGILNPIRGLFEPFREKGEGLSDKILKISKSFVLLSASMFVLSKIKPESLETLKTLFDYLGFSLAIAILGFIAILPALKNIGNSLDVVEKITNSILKISIAALPAAMAFGFIAKKLAMLIPIVDTFIVDIANSDKPIKGAIGTLGLLVSMVAGIILLSRYVKGFKIGTGITLLAIAGFIFILTKIVNYIEPITDSEGNIKDGYKTIGYILAGLGAFMLLARGFKASSSIGLLIALGAIYIIKNIAVELGTLVQDRLAEEALYNGLYILGGIGAMLSLMSVIVGHAKDAYKAGAVILDFAVAIAAIVVCLKIIDGLNDGSGTFWTFFGIWALFMSSLIIIFSIVKDKYASDIKAFGRVIITFGVTLSLMAVVFAIIAGTLSKFTPDKMLSVLKGFAIIVTSLVVIMASVTASLAILSKFNIGASSVIIFGSTIVGMIVAMSAIVTYMSNLKTDEIKHGLYSLSIAIGTIVVVMFGIVAALAIMKKAEISKVSVLGFGLIIIAIVALLSAITVAVQKFSNSEDPLNNILLLGGLIAGLEIIMFSMIGALAIMKKAEISVSTVLAFGTTIVAIVGVLSLITSSIIAASETENITNGIIVLAAGVIAFLVIALTLIGIGKMGASAAPSMLAFGATLISLGLSILAIAGALALIASVGPAGVDTIIYFLTSVINLIPVVVEKVLDGVDYLITWILEKIPEFLKTLNNNIPAFCYEVVRLIVNIFYGLARAIHENEQLISDALYEVLHVLFITLPTIIVDVLTKIIPEAINMLFVDLPRMLKRGFEAVDWAAIGKNFLDFLVGGIKGAWNAIKDIGSWLGNLITGGTKEALGINSPSKEFEDIGGYCMEGLANGLTENEDLIDLASFDVGDNLKDAFGGIDLTSLLGNSADLNPTITPVLDLSNVEAGAGSISSLLGGSNLSLGSLGLSSGISGIMKNQNGSESSIIDTIMSKIGGALGDKLASLGDKFGVDINSLGDRFEGMSVNIDGNALVGSISGKMNNALGKIVSRK